MSVVPANTIYKSPLVLSFPFVMVGRHTSIQYLLPLILVKFRPIVWPFHLLLVHFLPGICCSRNVSAVTYQNISNKLSKIFDLSVFGLLSAGRSWCFVRNGNDVGFLLSDPSDPFFNQQID